MKKSTVALSVAFLVLSSAVSAATPIDEVLNRLLGKPQPKSVVIGYDKTAEHWGEDSGARRDERFVDERQGGIAPKATAQPSSMKRDRAPREQVSQGESHRTLVGAQEGCFSAARSWEGAATLAQQGREEQAVRAYLKLFATCNKESELVGTAYQAKNNLPVESVVSMLEDPVLASPKLQSAAYVLKSQVFYKKSKTAAPKDALAFGRPLKDQAIELKDVGMLEALAWLEHRAGNSQGAERLLRSALKLAPEREALREALATIMLARNKPEAAWAVIQPVDSDTADALKASIRVTQAQEALKESDYKAADTLAREALALDPDNAAALETQGWATLQQGKPAKAKTLFNAALANDPDNAGASKGLVAALQANGETRKVERLAAQPGETGAIAKEALAQSLDSTGRHGAAAQLRGEQPENASAIGGAAGFRSKSGTSGEGKLQLTVAPEVTGTYSGETTTIQVEAGRVSAENGVANASGEMLSLKAEQSLGAAVARLKLTGVDLGASHLGLEVGYRSYGDSGMWDLAVTRSLMTDSLRSLGAEAGYGAASKTAVRLMTSHRVSGNANYESMTALGVVTAAGSRNNGFVEHDSALLFDMPTRNGLYTAVGPVLHVGAYGQDENRFTPGRAGYYSPETDLGAGAKVRFSTPEGQTWLVSGSAQGLYSTRSFYTGSVTTLAVEGRLAGGILLNSQLIGMAGLSAKTSSSYTDVTGWVGVAIPISPRSKLYATDLQMPQLVQ